MSTILTDPGKSYDPLSFWPLFPSEISPDSASSAAAHFGVCFAVGTYNLFLPFSTIIALLLRVPRSIPANSISQTFMLLRNLSRKSSILYTFSHIYIHILYIRMYVHLANVRTETAILYHYWCPAFDAKVCIIVCVCVCVW